MQFKHVELCHERVMGNECVQLLCEGADLHVAVLYVCFTSLQSSQTSGTCSLCSHTGYYGYRGQTTTIIYTGLSEAVPGGALGSRFSLLLT